jgi:hypothetical protein
MKSLVVGMWEVGKWLFWVLSKRYTCVSKEKTDIEIEDGVDFMHICFPYSEWFVNEVERLVDLYKPMYTVIHSTVPVWTTQKCADFFSPIVGKHPHLEESVATFTKWIAWDDVEILEQYLNHAGIATEIFSSTDSLEFAKIMCTTRYGMDICFMKMMEQICNERGYDFEEVYTNRTNNYNTWYLNMDNPEYWRPVLKPMPWKIGWHCVVQNTAFERNLATDFVKNFNDSLASN